MNKQTEPLRPRAFLGRETGNGAVGETGRVVMPAMGAGQGFFGEGFCGVKLGELCARAFSDFWVTTLLRHHCEVNVYKGMLSRLRRGTAPMGTPATYLEAPGNTV